MLKNSYAALFITLIFLPSSLMADFSQAMQTDRPDFTEGTQAVESGHVQFEIGNSFSRDSGEEEYGVLESLARIGVLADTEIRLVYGGYRFLENDDLSIDGSGDASIGFKQEITKAEDSWLDFSIIGEVGLPLGSADFQGTEATPGMKFLFARDLDCSLALSGNLNFTYLKEDGERYLETATSLSAGIPVTDSIGSYLEYFGIFVDSDAPDQAPQHNLNGGFTYAVSPNVQLDAFIGFGLNSSAPDTFAGVGISFRL